MHDVLEDRLSRHIPSDSDSESAGPSERGGETLNASGWYFLGVSIGMYAGKIAGLFIPRLQAFGFRSDMGSRLRHNLFTILFFSAGVSFTLLMTMVPPLDIP